VPEPLTRRQRLRAQTLDEIKAQALAQVAAGGAGALSLNAIAKAMGMSGPAIYRYFASRDALLAALVTDGYRDLTAALEAAPPDLAAVAAAYRGWALEHPRRYELLFGVRPEGFADPEEAIATVHGAMLVLLRVLGDLVGDCAGPQDALDEQLAAWGERRGGGGASPLVLRLGVLTWTRLHGIVSLELAGVFADMGIDAAELVAAELRAIAAAA
jgi:AcrR family transcriptional regulator